MRRIHAEEPGTLPKQSADDYGCPRDQVGMDDVSDDGRHLLEVDDQTGREAGGISVPASEVIGFALAKRLMECWTLDPGFPDEMSADPQAAFTRRGIDLDPSLVQELCDDRWRIAGNESPLLRQYRSMEIKSRLRRRDMRLDEGVTDPRIAGWRRRQLQRMLVDMGPGHSGAQGLHVIAFELQTGCSVGCWFCGVSAGHLTRIWRYDDANALLWQGCLDVFHRRLGAAMAMGFCYWASDPLDNPDYEHFAEDFRRQTGRYPAMSTAIPLKDVARTRRILAASRETDGGLHRFSVLNQRMLRDIHAAFSPIDLLRVELAGLQRGAPELKANAGRARMRPNADVTPGDDYTSIACISGFLVNMVEKSVRLVTPCSASDRWPEGYWTLATGHFNDASDLEALLDSMIARHMDEMPSPDRRLRFAPAVAWTMKGEHCMASSRHMRQMYRATPDMVAAGNALTKGDATLDMLAARISEEAGMDLAAAHSRARDIVVRFEARGLLDQEPVRDDG